jgi:hypothetical protein
MLSCVVKSFDVSTVVNQDLDNTDVSLHDSVMQRSKNVFRGRIWVGLVSNQELGYSS